MCSLSARIENNLCSVDGKMTKKGTRTNRARIYAEAKRWCQGAGIKKEIVMDGLFLFHGVQTCAAHLHSPLTVVMIYMILAEERSRKDKKV